MTTEVLRNMLLAGSDLLEGLRTVVLDEVHYLQDPYRGGVWEEVLVLCPPEVAFVCLSATVANATELGAWLRSVRGPTDVVVERRRPVLLRHHFALCHRAARAEELSGTDLIPLLDGGRAGSEGLRVDQAVRRALPQPTGRPSGGAASVAPPPVPRPRAGPRSSRPLTTRTCCRPSSSSSAGPPATTPSASACATACASPTRTSAPPSAGSPRPAPRGSATTTSTVLGYPEWLEGLEAGVAAHHAGLVPAFREAVEACFAAGLLQVVFATETLSLGHQHAGPHGGHRAVRQVRRGRPGQPDLGGVRPADRPGRPSGPRPRGPRRRALVTRHQLRRDRPGGPGPAARPALLLPPDLQPGRQPGAAVRPTHGPRGPPPLVRPVAGRGAPGGRRGGGRRSTGPRPAPRRSSASSAGSGRGQPTNHEGLVEHLGRRLAVLEELGYVDGWRLTDRRAAALPGVYHESDLLVAEALAGDALEGAEPAVLAGVLSALVFERAPGPPDPGPRAARAGPGPRGRAPPAGPGRRPARGAPPGRPGRNGWPAWATWPSGCGRWRRSTWCPAPASPSRAWPGRWPPGPGGPPSPRPSEVAATDVGRDRPGRLRTHGQAGGRPGRPGGPGGTGPGHGRPPPTRRWTCCCATWWPPEPRWHPPPPTGPSPSLCSGMFPYVEETFTRRGGGHPPALRDQPRPAGVRPGQPARGGQGRPLRPLLALAQEPAPALPRRVRGRPGHLRGRHGRRHRGPGPGRAALRAGLLRVRRRLGGPAGRASTWPASRPPTC